jgi:hypothetical protein
VQAVSISYETMTFDEVIKMPNSQRIAMLRIREMIKKKLDEDLKKKQQ